jgi:hypothetical protein
LNSERDVSAGTSFCDDLEEEGNNIVLYFVGDDDFQEKLNNIVIVVGNNIDQEEDLMI